MFKSIAQNRYSETILYTRTQSMIKKASQISREKNYYLINYPGLIGYLEKINLEIYLKL